MLSNIIAFDGNEYFDPATGDVYDPTTAASLIASEHAAGNVIEGLDTGTAAISDAQNQANLQAAAAQAAAQVGVTPGSQSTWSGTQMYNYLTALQAIIVNNASNFNQATVQIAQNMVIDPSLQGTQVTTGSTVSNTVTNAVQQAATTLANSAIGKTFIGGVQAINNGANAIISAANSISQTVATTAQVLSLVFPLAAVYFLYLITKSVGNSPGGEGGKLISSGTKGAKLLLS